MRSERAFGGTKVYGITVDCPCKDCDLRGCGCASICDAYKKYKFILTILNKNRQAKARAASECRMMRDERIAEWRRNRCWPKGKTYIMKKTSAGLFCLAGFFIYTGISF